MFDTDSSPEEFDFRAGDVVLTTRDGLLPALLRAFVGAPVSHAAIMINADYAIEARDDAWDLSEQGGRVFIRSRLELFQAEGLERVVVRRPPAVDHELLIAFAVDIVEREPNFANALLAMGALLKLKLRFQRLALALADLLTGGRDALVGEREWVEAMADGTKTVLCTEVVYRALLESGSPLDLEGAAMFEMMQYLPEAEPLLPANERCLAARFEHLAAQRRAEPKAPQVCGSGGSGLLLKSKSNLRTRTSERLSEGCDGDRADLVTPGDLYRLGPLQTVADWQRVSEGSWILMSRP